MLTYSALTNLSYKSRQSKMPPMQSKVKLWIQYTIDQLSILHMLLFACIITFTLLCMYSSNVSVHPMVPLSLLILSLHFMLTDEVQIISQSVDKWFHLTFLSNTSSNTSSSPDAHVVFKHAMLAHNSIAPSWRIDVHPTAFQPTALPHTSELKIPF